MKKNILIIIILLLTCFLSAQDNNPSNEEGDTIVNSESSEQLPAGFMNIQLGQTMDMLEEALTDNSYFDYRGKPDVDMRISRERTLIECSGFSYIKKGYFQFYKEKLIIITIIIDEKEMDYYSFYTNLEEKYGKPVKLNPEGVYWENSDITMALEKPLSVKYTDKKSFAEIKEKSAAKRSEQKKLKEEFVEIF